MGERRPPWLGPLVAVVVVFAIFSALTPDLFLRSSAMLVMARQTVVVAICALGMTMVIVTGGIDLSTGSLVALTTVMLARFLNAGYSPFVAVPLALAVCALIGATIGVLVGRFRMLPFIVTLGAMSILRGTAKGLANEQKIECKTQGIEALLSADVTAPGLWIALGLTIAIALLLGYTRFGRHVFAVGSNEAAARLCGIDPVRVKVLVYALSSVLAGIGGVMQLSTLTLGDPTDSVGLELEVIAAVVIGGASLGGGDGSIVGTVLGAMLMTIIKTGAVDNEMPNFVQEIATGVIIVVAVAIDRARHARVRR
ncbi:MAG: ABC transporter permease [Labilithrix sp.]|nr:ABC transporter permease [Labilithrix sp.]MCW5816729.1 ABC transporter permease [Labilithrix sp.]